MTDALHRRFEVIADLDAQRNAAIAPLTTYKIGGPADHLIVPHTLEALQGALSVLNSINAPFIVLGNGSNVLFADAGYRGTVLKLGRGFATHKLTRDAIAPGQHLLEAGAALSITKLLRVAKSEKLAGIECLGGVPATVGGAVRMNAGTRLGEVKDSLRSAQLVRPHEAPSWVPARSLGLAYRQSKLPARSVVTAARFVCTDSTPEMRERLSEVLAYRKSTQPLHLPSCGSVFANPVGDAAGRLIEAAGLKGRRIGGAQVSEQHANWIVNTGDAKAVDVRALIDLIVSEVGRTAGVTLRHEVRFLGDWGGGS